MASVSASAFTYEEFVSQLIDLFENNLPPVDLHNETTSYYGLLSDQIASQLVKLHKNKHRQFTEQPLKMIQMMIQLAFNDYLDGFNVSSIYTKRNVKPHESILNSLVPQILEILDQCAQFVHFKRIPANVKSTDKTKVSQDAFMEQLVDLLDSHLPPIEGDRLIQIGSTFSNLRAT